MRGGEGSQLMLHVATVVAGAEVVAVVPFEAARRNMPDLGAYLTDGADSTGATSRSTLTLLSPAR